MSFILGLFQLTRSRGAWLLSLVSLAMHFVFQLTRSRGAWRHKCIYPYWQIFKFQLTRSRGAWHSCKNTLSAFPISTHTLTWSVTLLVISLIGITGFQLTRSRGAWPQKNSPKAVIKIISTHTLTWSVTGLWWNCRFLWQFQLTRSRGAWLLSSEYIYFYNDFNSHAHVERDPCGDLQQRYVENFNSHAHVERDRLKVATLQLMKGISTHTLTWSVTRPRSLWKRHWKFQLTRSRGAWHPQLWPYNRQRYFNSHAHVERDLFSCSACRP